MSKSIEEIRGELQEISCIYDSPNKDCLDKVLSLIEQDRKERDEELHSYIGWIKAAKCPACDGSGGIPCRVSDESENEGWDLEQCQWCDEKNKLLSLLIPIKN